MEGDDILLAEPQPEAEQPKKRDEWMTTLPPERKVRILSSSDRPPPLQFFSDRPAGRCFDWGSGPVIYLQGADRPIILASLLILIREILPRFHHFRLILTDPDPAQGRFLAQISSFVSAPGWIFDPSALDSQPGVTMQSTAFHRTGKEGRGDASAWTDSPLDKAHKAKQRFRHIGLRFWSNFGKRCFLPA